MSATGTPRPPDTRRDAGAARPTGVPDAGRRERADCRAVRRVAALAAALVLALGLASVAPAQTPLRLQLQWSHQAQFAGVYVAEELGYYRRAGLDVEVLPGGVAPDGSTIEPFAVLGRGDADVVLSWLANAIDARERGVPVVHVAQAFQRSGLMLACRRDRGVHGIEDIAGRRVGVWDVGDVPVVRSAARHAGVDPDAIRTVVQRPEAADLIDGTVDCATVMTYNELPILLEAGFTSAQLALERMDDLGVELLEDGFYASPAMAGDPEGRATLARFVTATMEGWREARDNPDLATQLVLRRAPAADPDHQRAMLDAAQALVGPVERFGWLDLTAFEASLRVLGADPDGRHATAWTHRVARRVHPPRTPTLVTPAIRHEVDRVVNGAAFYALGLFATVFFATAGFMTALQRRYDLWGSMVLAALPALGGGTLRDLIVGGVRSPPFVFADPWYVLIVLAVVTVGAVAARLAPRGLRDTGAFERVKNLFDTIGMATFTVVGANVAFTAELDWFWAPILAGITVAGGGMLRDIVTGREPDTFTGEPYEEIAATGGILMWLLLLWAGRFEHAGWLVTATILIVWLFVFVARTLVVRHGWRSFRPGQRGAAEDAA